MKLDKNEPYLTNVYLTQIEYGDVLGANAFVFWLELFTYVDRSGNWKQGDEMKTSYPIEELAKKTDTTKSTIYRYVKKLWEHGLIDLSEGENFTSKKIIVYCSPFNSDNDKVPNKKLKKIRNWIKD